MMSPPLRVLCLDIEGGFGGSSRSLFESLRHIDQEHIEPIVWCRKLGPIYERYDALDIECHVMPAMPRVTSLPPLSRNLAVFAIFLRDWLASGEFRRAVLAESRRVNVVHFNHESLFFLARWLRGRSAVPTSMHIRTILRPSCFARWQERVIIDAVDELVFITENEREALERLAGRPSKGTVIHNIAVPADPVEPASAHPPGKGFTIACLSNYAWVRGIDRLIEIAEALSEAGRRDIHFLVAGEMTLSRSLPGDLGVVGRRGGTLADHAENRQVADMFDFLGHVSDPERVLAAADVLVKPTREANPWGRDIIEALAAGKPVLTCGRYNRFVEDGVTGVLQAEFDAREFARRIIELADSPDLVEAMSAAARARTAIECNGPARAADLVQVWQRLAGAKCR